MDELVISEEARRLFSAAGTTTDCGWDELIQAACAKVAATELRRIAKQFECKNDSLLAVLRAHVLDPE
jgi:hypothetical protein